MIGSQRQRSLAIYGGLYPAIVLAAAWTIAGSQTAFTDYALLVAVISLAATLLLIAIRGGTHPYTQDWAASSPDEPLPPPLRSITFLVTTAAVGMLALILL